MIYFLIKKVTNILKDDEARFVDVQRALPRQRLETPEQVSIHSNTNAQGFGVPQLFPEASR